MNKAVKIILCIIGAVIVLIGGFCLWWYRGVDLEKRYKGVFDKAFDGSYNMTVTDSGTYSAPTALIKLPERYKDYDVQYFDKDGNERHFMISSRIGLAGTPREILSVAFNRSRYFDMFLKEQLESQSSQIFLDQISGKLPGYFGDTVEPNAKNYMDHCRRYNGEGVDFSVVAIDETCFVLYDKAINSIVFPKECREDISRSVSPDTCLELSKQDISSYANNKNAYLSVTVKLTDTDTIGKAEDYKDKTEKFILDYRALSDFGGNCLYRIIKNTDPDDDSNNELLYSEEILLGEKSDAEEYITALKKTIKL
ncbi:hypothetical protein SAMN02910447_00660 [Ruminococcus sp. YE71]|uniref:hypothetical protein n=1 Tax=unclassified Ruminococcus TaxID=2608920 RepID=UPI000889EC90|nr:MULTISPECIES: hypothetical protein [unclassified Ruminococcus]SDA13414.1 hypothetical protein SAMN02910446_00659 [Ruminococcus sp. YE78]SFW19011.1 hypothetical protein SAMN02910447_00660 [Ruminococcus sp. YE71]